MEDEFDYEAYLNRPPHIRIPEVLANLALYGYDDVIPTQQEGQSDKEYLDIIQDMQTIFEYRRLLRVMYEANQKRRKNNNGANNV